MRGFRVKNPDEASREKWPEMVRGLLCGESRTLALDRLVWEAIRVEVMNLVEG